MSECLRCGVLVEAGYCRDCVEVEPSLTPPRGRYADRAAIAARQAEVVRLSKEGVLTDEIAHRLGVTKRTVIRDRRAMDVSVPRKNSWDFMSERQIAAEKEKKRALMVAMNGGGR